MFLTNHHKLTASIVINIYKDRWEIELSFKALKQNFKVKTFVGTNSNAVETQIWAAWIALLLLKRLHHLSLAGWSLSNLAAMLRLNLFTYRELRAWLQYSYHTPPIMPEQVQLPLLP
ncbi:transposase [Desulfarculales bacterium]